MTLTMGEFTERADRWREQATRFRALARLLGDERGAGPLAELARGIDEQARSLEALRAGVIVQSLRTEVLLAELDVLRARARAILSEQRHRHGGVSFTIEDVREESRLCVEEAAAMHEIAEKKLVTEQAFALAQLAEEISRRGK
ncbi:MAG TPA: hypothetical protein VKZ79_02540 [Alphaproteobacteria bacterium]|nr:hypothetical protein [Alphaproteobacteria bacterium]